MLMKNTGQLDGFARSIGSRWRKAVEQGPPEGRCGRVRAVGVALRRTPVEGARAEPPSKGSRAEPPSKGNPEIRDHENSGSAPREF